ncbi:MAG: hypothetical protein COB08_005640 [Rhodobacteraceae bacterium]|nr:hypothetical protein [Paracoccaceae bacterium]
MAVNRQEPSREVSFSALHHSLAKNIERLSLGFRYRKFQHLFATSGFRYLVGKSIC